MTPRAMAAEHLRRARTSRFHARWAARAGIVGGYVEDEKRRAREFIDRARDCRYMHRAGPCVSAPWAVLP